MNWVLSPLAWLVVALLLGLGALKMRKRWLGAPCALLALAAYAAMTPLVANSLTAYLERPLAVPSECVDGTVTVVVLAGGVDRVALNAEDFNVLNLASRRRIECGVQYLRQRGQGLIVFSGGTMPPGTIPHARLMRSYAAWLGVPEAETAIEPFSLDTWGNARGIAALTPAIPHRITLVTSAIHMRRAAFAFQSAGYVICPLPCDLRTAPIQAPSFLLPRTTALLKTEAALHEFAGLVYYRWREWRQRT